MWAMRAQHILTAHLFYDVAAAFYRALRQCIAPFHEEDSQLRKLLATLGLPGEALQELQEKLQQTAELVRGGASAHLIAAVAALFKGTWFKLDACATRLVLTRRGTRPGDAAADVLYAFCVSAYMRCNEAAIAAIDRQTLCPPLQGQAIVPGSEPMRTLSPASWADDIVRLLTAPAVPQFIQQLHDVARISDEQAASAGILFSYAPHKTAALVAAAHNHRRAKQQCADLCPSRDTHTLQIVDVYRHLGSIATADGTPKQELHYRGPRPLGPCVLFWPTCLSFAGQNCAVEGTCGLSLCAWLSSPLPGSGMP